MRFPGRVLLARSSRRWRTRVLPLTAVAVGIVLIPVLTPVGPAQAAWTPCDAPNYSLYWARWYTNQGTHSEPDLVGAGANQNMNIGYLCSPTVTPNNNSTFVKVAAKQYVGGFALAGAATPSPTSCWEFFAQQSPDGVFSDTVFGSCINPWNEYHHTWNQVVCCPGSAGLGYVMRSNIDVTIFRQSTFDPLTSWTGPFEMMFAGATLRNRSDVPGYSYPGFNAPTSFDTMQLQLSPASTTWYSTCYAYLYNGADYRYGASSSACNHVYTFTNLP